MREIFDNPTIQSVTLEIRFPALFYIESKIGDFQKAIFDKFPASALLSRKSINFFVAGQQVKAEDINKANQAPTADAMIWEFKSEDNYTLHVINNSITISSTVHKTYNNEGGEKFREMIIFAIGKFIEIVSIPRIDRIGLRYINTCPFPTGGEEEFNKYYKIGMPFSRFPLSKIQQSNFTIVSNIKDNYTLRFTEAINSLVNPKQVLLDYDASKTNITPDKYLETADALHEIISEEFEKSIGEGLINYMKQKNI